MRRLILAVLLGIGTLAFGASTASAHTLTVTCSQTGPDMWIIAASEDMNFTANGATPSTGFIPGGGSAVVSFSGASLTVIAIWTDNFAPATVIGMGPCEVVDTTTTTTTSTTTTSTTTTVPDTTTTVPDTTTTTDASTTTTTDASTTTTTDATTTTTVPVLVITAISPVCLRDAPYIDVTFGNQTQFNGHTATVTFIANNGQVVGTDTTTYQAGTTARFVYPGAVIDAAGNPLDWPGWVFDGDEWVVDPTDAFLRENLTVVVEVNPTASDTVSYPPATPSCNANPPTTPRGKLPQTR